MSERARADCRSAILPREEPRVARTHVAVGQHWPGHTWPLATTDQSTRGHQRTPLDPSPTLGPAIGTACRRCPSSPRGGHSPCGLPVTAPPDGAVAVTHHTLSVARRVMRRRSMVALLVRRISSPSVSRLSAVLYATYHMHVRLYVTPYVPYARVCLGRCPRGARLSERPSKTKT